jgi:hypothetical protein
MSVFLNYHHLRYFRIDRAGNERHPRRGAPEPVGPCAKHPAAPARGEPGPEAVRAGAWRAPVSPKRGASRSTTPKTIGRAGEELVDVMRNRAPGTTRQILQDWRSRNAVPKLSGGFPQARAASPWGRGRDPLGRAARACSWRSTPTRWTSCSRTRRRGATRKHPGTVTCSPSNRSRSWACPHVAKETPRASPGISATCR